MTDSITLHGRHLIDGAWIEGSDFFTADRTDGVETRFARGTAGDIDLAVQAAAAASLPYSRSSRESRALFLEAIADAIEERGAAITAVAMAETGLPAARLDGERGRTTGQLRLFAKHIRDGAYLDRL
jgi:2,5-dioxopentanoate dehydrogenase